MNLMDPGAESAIAGVRERIDAVDDRIFESSVNIIELLSERNGLVDEVKVIKEQQGLPPLRPERFAEMRARLGAKAVAAGVSPSLVESIWTSIHENSVARQERDDTQQKATPPFVGHGHTD